MTNYLYDKYILGEISFSFLRECLGFKTADQLREWLDKHEMEK